MRVLSKLGAALRLLLHFLRAVLVSGLQTLGVILRAGGPAGAPPPVAVLRVSYAPMTDTGAVLLGCLVSLTPGTTTLDIDPQRRELLLHVLDASDVPAVLAGIRRDFEAPLQRLFPEPVYGAAAGTRRRRA